jgi:hypothetical protein
MGILKHLLFWPVTGPMYLTEFSLSKVQGVVQGELTDDTRIKEELLDLQLRLEMGDIDDGQYVAEEARLMEQLREVRRWREQYGMATRGGVVQVAEEEQAEEERQPQALTGDATLDISLDFSHRSGDEEK